MSTVVSTDDEKISDLALEKGIAVHHRSAELSSDTASTTDLMREIATGFGWEDDDDVIMLYLTYPQRTYEDIENI